MSEYVVIMITTGNIDEARKITAHLVQNRIAACVNIVPSIESHYWWQNNVNRDEEVLLIIKTRKSKIKELESAVRSLHSYETPEIIALPLEYGMTGYLKWIDDSLKT